MSDHDFIWPPPSEELDQYELVDLDTGRAVIAAAAPEPAVGPAVDRPAPERASGVTSPELTWPPVDSLTDALVTIDATSPWAETADRDPDWDASPPTRVDPLTGGSSFESYVESFPAVLADEAASTHAPMWTRWAAAVLIVGLGGGIAIERRLREVSASASETLTSARAVETAPPFPWRGGAPSRASSETSYASADLRRPRGVGGDRFGGSPPAFDREVEREPEPMPARTAAKSASHAPATTTAAPSSSTLSSSSHAPALVTSALYVPPASSPPSEPLAPVPALPIDRTPTLEATVAVAAPPAPPLAARTAAVETIGIRDEARIEATLDRYRVAYASLDVAAARSVWPSVDQRALERAFGSLKSQGLDFDKCATDVQGPTATVACHGRATWVPRIGSQRPRTEAHQWRFRLRKVDESWMIVNAEAR